MAVRKAYICTEMLPPLGVGGAYDSAVWEAHFAARESALNAVFGAEALPGKVFVPDFKVRRSLDLIRACPGASVKSFAPCEDRPAWHFVSNGLAQPGNGDPDKLVAGECSFGREFVISSERNESWPIHRLFDLMASVALQGWRVLPDQCIGDWPTPIVSDGNPDLNSMITCSNPAYANRIVLPAGTCDLIHVVGVTSAEADYALAHSQLRPQGVRALASFFMTDDPYGPITDGQRSCLTRDPDWPEMWRRAIRQVELHWPANAR